MASRAIADKDRSVVADVDDSSDDEDSEGADWSNRDWLDEPATPTLRSSTFAAETDGALQELNLDATDLEALLAEDGKPVSAPTVGTHKVDSELADGDGDGSFLISDWA